MISDIEKNWILKATGSSEKLLFEHRDLEGVYRVIDMTNTKVRYSDVNRIQDIRDINKIISKEDDRARNMELYLGIANDVLDEIDPISFPYERGKYICYIEAFPGYSENKDDCVGILYFHDKVKNDMIQAKKFFRILPVVSMISYEEIDMMTYNDVKEKYFRRIRKHVDKVTEQRTSES